MRRTSVVLAAVTAIGAVLLGVPSSPSASAGAAAITGTLRATASMRVARAAHSATSLGDGTVLVVGGFGEHESEGAGAKIFDPRQNRFIDTGQPALPRHSHTATRLMDGRVLVAGGMSGGGYTASAELYDPAAHTFSPTGRLATARAGHEAVRLDDGRVLVVGGVGPGWTFLASAEIYDPRTGRFTAAGEMAEPREGHVAVSLGGGRVLVAGGHRGRGAAIVISRTAEIFEVASGRFAPTGSMAARRHKADAAVLDSGRILVLGGADERDNEGIYTSVEIFDPASGRFEPGPPMRLGRYKHRGTTVMLSGGRLLLAGGTPAAEEYDPASGAGAVVDSDARLAGQFSAVAGLPDGRVLVTGGYGEGRGPRTSAWIYAPAGR